MFFFLKYFRDRLRTATNILGDSIGAGIVDFLCKDQLKKIDEDMEENLPEENRLV
jgi:solute carrier family 1 (high affinity glutamate transporter) protein 3